ncbi:MAG: Hpt domain-containing protein [bacterium]|jgi:HPt (histidine-containing phosphotransfer) domain-containing protein|nr:Hpt domain-containing protein [bacterium]
MKDKPCIDRAIIDKLVELGGTGLLQKMLAIFLENTPGKILIIQEGLAVGDYPAIANAAHSLLSSTGNIGAQQLYALCHTIEQKARQRDEDELPRLIEALPTSYQALMEALAHLKDEKQYETNRSG